MSTSNNQEYYDAKLIRTQDRMSQVGKTLLGNPVDKKMLDIIAENISTAIQINGDCVVDLGAGNGLITEAVAPQCKKIFALELNRGLLAIAKLTCPRNVSYIESDILSISEKLPEELKYYMYEVLQHLELRDLRTLLADLFKNRNAQSLFIGGVPDDSRKFDFYCKEESKFFYYRCLEDGNNPIATWWDAGFIKYVCSSMGLTAKIFQQPASLYTSHYRFDVLVT